jgi:hypothetical protein
MPLVGILLLERVDEEEGCAYEQCDDGNEDADERQ